MLLGLLYFNIYIYRYIYIYNIYIYTNIYIYIYIHIYIYIYIYIIYIYFYIYISNPSILYSVDGFCDGLFCSTSFTASIPLMLSMLESILTISNQTRIESLGNTFEFMLSIICSKYSVPLVLA